ncbi:MAG: hypothetical protein KFF50_02610 [Desulfatitalea sp.]|nr:hypothetical protein [Desulfatitalea sp.]
MEDVDEMDLKAEIDRISQKIDAIVETVERLDPARKNETPHEGEDPIDP